MILRSNYVQYTLMINLHGMTVPVFFVFPVEAFNPANSDGLSSVWTLKGIIQNSVTVIPCIMFVYNLTNTETGGTWGLVWISHDFLVARLWHVT